VDVDDQGIAMAFTWRAGAEVGHAKHAERVERRFEAGLAEDQSMVVREAHCPRQLLEGGREVRGLRLEVYLARVAAREVGQGRLEVQHHAPWKLHLYSHRVLWEDVT